MNDTITFYCFAMILITMIGYIQQFMRLSSKFAGAAYIVMIVRVRQERSMYWRKRSSDAIINTIRHTLTKKKKV